MHGINDKAIEQIVKLAVDCGMRKIVLFGSRARGDYKRGSDIDLAVYGGDVAAFRVDVEELVDTLLCFDIVDMNGSVSAELAAEIEKEGITLYEKI